MIVLVPVLDDEGNIVGDMPVEAPDGTPMDDPRFFPDYSKPVEKHAEHHYSSESPGNGWTQVEVGHWTKEK